MRRMTEAERELAESALQFVPKAIAALKRSYPGISKQVARIDAEGIAHLAVCRAAQTYDPAKSKPTTYFSRAIRNALLKEIVRRRKLLVDGPMRVAMTEVELGMHSPQAARVSMALAAIPEDMARLIRGKFFEGGNLAEIARQEGCTRSTVRRRLVKALLLFRAALENLPGPL